MSSAVKPLDEAMQQAVKSNNPTLLNSLYNVKIALTHELEQKTSDSGVPQIVKGAEKNLSNIDYSQGVKILSDIADHTKFTGNPSDDKALNAAVKKAYGAARESMNSAAEKADPSLGKEVKSLNKRFGDLSAARSSIEHRDLVLKRQNILTLANKFAIPVAVVGSIATGNYKTAAGVLLGELAVKAGGSTAAKTRIAQFLERLGPEERQGILNSTPAIKNVWERLTGNVSPGEEAPKTAALKYAQAPKLGLSVESINPQSVASKVDARDLGLIRDYLKKNDPNYYFNVLYKLDPQLNNKENTKLIFGNTKDTNSFVDSLYFLDFL